MILTNIIDNDDNNEKTNLFKNMGRNIPGGNFQGGNFPGENSPRGDLIGENFPAASFPRGEYSWYQAYYIGNNQQIIKRFKHVQRNGQAKKKKSMIW